VAVAAPIVGASGLVEYVPPAIIDNIPDILSQSCSSNNPRGRSYFKSICNSVLGK
jgi:hypothetical protein